MEIDVRGTKVVLRDRLPAREAWPLRNLMIRARQGELLSFEDEAQALALVVESWDFEGDPHDVESYACLDLTEFLALDAAAAQHLNQRVASKN